MNSVEFCFMAFAFMIGVPLWLISLSTARIECSLQDYRLDEWKRFGVGENVLEAPTPSMDEPAHPGGERV